MAEVVSSRVTPTVCCYMFLAAWYGFVRDRFLARLQPSRTRWVITGAGQSPHNPCTLRKVNGSPGANLSSLGVCPGGAEVLTSRRTTPGRVLCAWNLICLSLDDGLPLLPGDCSRYGIGTMVLSKVQRPGKNLFTSSVVIILASL